MVETLQPIKPNSQDVKEPLIFITTKTIGSMSSHHLSLVISLQDPSPSMSMLREYHKKL